MEWRVLKYPERCLINEHTEEKIIKEYSVVYAKTTPPPEVFDFEKQKYVFELFRDGVVPEICAAGFKSK